MADLKLKKGTNSFRLVGKMKVGPNTFEIDSKSKSGSGFIKNRAYIGVDCGNDNVIYAEMFDGYFEDREKKIYLHGKKPNPLNNGRFTDDYSDQFSITWDDRFNENIFKRVGPSCLVVLNPELEGDGIAFISPYDAIAYLAKNIDKFTENVAVEVKGDLEYSYYNGKVKTTKRIKSISVTNADSESYGATFTQTIFVNSNSIGDLDKDNNLYPYSTLIPEYISKVGNIQVKDTCPLNYEMYLDAETGKKDILEKLLMRSSGYSRLTVRGNIVAKGSTKEINIEDFDDQTQMLINAGLYTPPKTGASDGGRKEYMIVNSIASGRDSEGRETPKLDIDLYSLSDLDALRTEFSKKVDTDVPEVIPVVETVAPVDDLPFDV